MSESDNRLKRRGIQVGIFVGLVSASGTILHFVVDERIQKTGIAVTNWSKNIFKTKKVSKLPVSDVNFVDLGGGVKITEYRITNSEYGSVPVKKPSSDHFQGGVSWGDSIEFCVQLIGSEARLPTTKELKQAREEKLTFDYSIGGEWTNDCAQFNEGKCAGRIAIDSSGSERIITGDRQLSDIGFRCAGLVE